jgi:DNA topoisomerase-3
MVILEPGWTKYDDYSAKDKILPKLKKGDKIVTDFRPVEKETNPPKHYTIETLNNYLKNPFKEDKAAVNSKSDDTEDINDDEHLNANDEAEYKAVFEGLELGTEATRTGIIDNARKSNYIQLKKDVYTILPDGIYLIESLSHMQIGMDKYKTAELGKALKKVFRGELKVADSTALAQKEIAEVFAVKEMTIEEDTDTGYYGDTVGKCPACGGDVVRTKFGYGCNKYKDGCKFTVNGVICGRVISASNVKKLLESGSTSKITGFTSKNGKTFNAVLKLDNGKIVFDFGNNSNSK